MSVPGLRVEAVAGVDDVAGMMDRGKVGRAGSHLADVLNMDKGAASTGKRL